MEAHTQAAAVFFVCGFRDAHCLYNYPFEMTIHSRSQRALKASEQRVKSFQHKDKSEKITALMALLIENEILDGKSFAYSRGGVYCPKHIFRLCTGFSLINF